MKKTTLMNFERNWILFRPNNREIWIVICSINTSMRFVHYQA